MPSTLTLLREHEQCLLIVINTNDTDQAASTAASSVKTKADYDGMDTQALSEPDVSDMRASMLA